MRHYTFIAIMLLAAAGCYGSTITVAFTHLPYTTGEGTYPGWSIATINDISPNQLLMCDDYYDDTYMPHADMVYSYSTLADQLTANLSGLMFGSQANAARNYEAAAYLSWEYYQLGYDSSTGNPGPTTAQNQTATDYNFAIWNLFDPAVSLSSL